MDTSLTWLERLAATPDGADWTRLTEQYGPLLQRWLAHTGVPSADRDDVLQEVLLAVVRGIGAFDHRGPGAFRAWLRGILTNQVRKYFRPRPQLAAVDLDQLATHDSALSRQFDREHDEFWAARALRAVEGDFTPNTWQAFRRQVLDGVAPAQVASELGLSTNAVILAKSRVLRRLRSELHGLIE